MPPSICLAVPAPISSATSRKKTKRCATSSSRWPRRVDQHRRLEAADIQAGIVGNFAGGMFTRQLHVGALLLEADDALRGIPTMHVEAACASGSLAVLTAAQWIAAGLHDCVLVVGAEQQKNDVARRRVRRARRRRRLPPRETRVRRVHVPETLRPHRRTLHATIPRADRARPRACGGEKLSPRAPQPAGADARHGPRFRHRQHRVAEKLAHRRQPPQALRLLADHRRRAAVVLCSERFLDKLGHRTSTSASARFTRYVAGLGSFHGLSRVGEEGRAAFSAGPPCLGPRHGNRGHRRSAHRTPRRRGPRLFLGQRGHRLRDHRAYRARRRREASCTTARRCSPPSVRKSSAPTPRPRPFRSRSTPAAA